MDIDLLSKMVKELILDSDEVALPGIGTFVAEFVPSTFSDKGYTINPPYRHLVFRQRQNDADTALVDFYASSNNVDSTTAGRIIGDFLGELKQTLKEKKAVTFPGLGRLRATRENNFFFIANEDLDIYPAGFGLESVSLKTHEETEDEISAAVVGLGAFIDFPEIEPIDVELGAAEGAGQALGTAGEGEKEEVTEADSVPEDIIDIEPIMEPVPEEAPVEKEEIEANPSSAEREEAKGENEGDVSEDEVPGENGGVWKRRMLWTLLILVIAAAVLFASFMLLAKYAPYALDRILYTREELSIINYKL